MDDAALVERIRNEDQTAWAELVDRHSGLLWRLARSIVNDDAAASDAMQTAWLRLLQHIDGVQDPAAVRGWLCTTVRREAIALSKSAQRHGATDPHDWAFDAPTKPESDPGAVSAQAEQNRTVLHAMREISDRCRELLTMHAHKVSYDEIAAAMDIAVGSIGPTKARCLDQLRRLPSIAQLEAAQ